MGERFKRAIERLYPTEEARQEKLSQHGAESLSLFEILKPGIEQLYLEDISFAVFGLSPDADVPFMRAGMESCCGSKGVVTQAHRDEMEVLITTFTKYKQVIWEA